jgi:hypothetical protein
MPARHAVDQRAATVFELLGVEKTIGRLTGQVF